MKRKKIIIVEDEVVIALDLQSMLEKFGYNVIGHFTRGEEVLDGIKKMVPDIILMDIKLEDEMDGIQTAELVNERYNIPIVFITSYSNKNIIERAKKINPFGYIVKPFEERELYTTIELALYKYSADLKLKESEKKYRELSESIQQIVVECDKDGKITYLNNTGMALLCVSPNEVKLGVSLTDFLIPRHFDNIKNRAQQHGTANGTKISRVHKMISRSHNIIVVEEFLSPLYDNGILIGYRGVLVDITERQNMLNKIKESEEKFSHIAEHINEAFWVVNWRDEKLLFANQVFHEIYGIPVGTELDYSIIIASRIHPDDREMVNLEYKAKAETGEFSLQYRIISKDNSVKWVHEKALPIKNKSGRVVKMVGYSTDITDEKRIQEELQRSEEYKENILKSMPDSLLVVNKEGYIKNAYVKIDESFLLKENRGNLEGNSIVLLFGITYTNKILDKIKRCFETGRLVFYELEYRIGKVKYWLEIRISLGNEESALLILRNVTEAKRNLIELQKYFNITEQTNELIVITDRNGLIEYVNPTLTEITGFQLHEVIGKTPSIFRSGKHNVSLYAELWNTILSGNSFSYEFVNKKKNGQEYIEEKIISPVKNSYGEIINFISTGRDITKEKKREKKIKAYQKFEKILEKKEQKYRTLSLIQGQETERKRLAREIHDGLGQMLTVTMSNLDNLRLGCVKDKEEKGKIIVAKQLVSEIIQESRRISHNLSPGGLYEFGLYPVIKQFVDRVNKNYKGLKIDFESNVRGVRFKNDIEINLYRIIQEGIQNIVKHSKSKTAFLVLSFDGKVLSLLIKDYGVGFDIKYMKDSSKHFNGLKNIGERAKIIDANVKYITEPGKGLEIQINLKTKVIAHD